MATRPDVSGRNLDLDSAVDEVTARYVGANPASEAQYERAKQSLPGGNTRTGMFYTPFPLAIATAARRNADRRRRPHLHRLRRRFLRRPLRSFASGDPRGPDRGPRRRHGLRLVQPLRGAAGDARLRTILFHRAGAIHQLGHRGQYHGAGHRPRRLRQGPGHGVRGRLSRRHHLLRPQERADQHALPLRDRAL